MRAHITFFSNFSQKKQREKMEASRFYSNSSSNGLCLIETKQKSSSFAPFVIQAMATQKKPSSSAATMTVSSKKAPNGAASVKLLTRVEQLKLLTKAEKAGLLSAAEGLGLSLSSIEKLGLLSKAEELGVLSAATNPATPTSLFTLSLGLLLLGPVFVFVVPEDYPWEIAAQVVVALVSVLGGSAAFAASNFVSDLQQSK